jgi:hypothetical protein
MVTAADQKDSLIAGVQVGNYAEIYRRNVEPIIPRDQTQNELFTRKGLLYGTPFD